MPEPAIGMLEFNSICKGIETCDAMLKESAVELVQAMTICPGKYFVLITGDVDAVRSSLGRGREVAGVHLVDTFLIPNAHPQIFPALTSSTTVESLGALGVIETFSAASTILAADAAVKAAAVDLLEIRLANGMGGKSFVTLTGDVGAVEAAVAAGNAMVEEEGWLVHSTVIPRPHPTMGKVVL